jgi:hypothetical protein
MRLTVFTALALALVGGFLPGCSKTATDRQESAGRGATGQSGTGQSATGQSSSGQSAAGAATGQASEGSTDDRKAPARPSSPSSK